MELDRLDELHRRTDEVLHYIWDPIGVSGVPLARDEYSGYVPRLVGLLMTGATENVLTDFLSEIKTVRMGLPSNREKDAAMAEILLDWKETLESKKPRILG
jgi:hypothetical protein